MPQRDWRAAIEDFTRVQRLVHLAVRMQPEDATSVQVECFKQKRVAYEDELTVQAANVGCAGRKGVAGPSVLAKMMEEARTEALGIINTYNYDLAYAIRQIRQDTPTANRNVYAKRLTWWEADRNEWKSKQIMLWNTVKWVDQATREFLSRNPTLYVKYAIVEPQTRAVCEVCQYWVRQGKVKLERMEEQEFPAHLNCPHRWRVYYTKRKVDCSTLWVGQTIEGYWEDIGGKALSEKGGAGSGNWGHTGRPGLVGGSGGGATRMVFGENISPDRQKAVNVAYSCYPCKVRDLMGEIVVHDEDGYEFEAGGQTFRAGGDWDVKENRMGIYANTDTAAIGRLMMHEVGHAVFEDWQRKVIEQAMYLGKMGWIDRATNMIDPNKTDPADYVEYTAHRMWDIARFGSAKEDGVTPYSTAWNTSTEIFAVLHTNYRSHIGSGSSPRAAASLTERYAAVNGAPTLGKVFAGVMVMYED